jgi:eukaryotic-like serine/threonine-protein kinase
MLVERWRRIESLFHEALTKDPAQRASFLDEACSGDKVLRREVESLLAHDKLASEFLESDGSSVKPEIPMELVAAGERIGPYTVIELLGAGGMGEVYKAHDQRLDRDVAVKFLSSRMANDASSIERFEREARAISALNHPNICTVHDVGETHGRRYIVLELLEGHSLKDRIADGPIGIREAASIANQVCTALEAAHDKGIVHRDLKPANIFITKTGQVKVLDFGLAKRGVEALGPGVPMEGATQSLTFTGAGNIMGTPAYMSPEQALGMSVDGRSDLFSLGVVLYEMTTGSRPFRGKTPAGLMGSLLTESPAKPSSVNSGVPAKLDRVILKALEKSVGSRYAFAAELSADLAPWLGSRPAHRATWIAAALTLVLAAGAFYLISRWQRERQRAADDVIRLTGEDQFASAFLRARAAGSAITEEQWTAMSAVVSIETTPPGAEIRWKNYSTPEATWQSLGRSPLERVRIPLGALRVQVSKDGFETLDRVLIRWNNNFHDPTGEVNLNQYPDRIRFELVKPGVLPAGMVKVPAGPFGIASSGFFPFPMESYLIDKYEVTNRQYKEFVDRGGYQNRAWWKERFVRDGRELSWEEAISLFRDSTGKPGPATWGGGSYPAGQEEYPVRGVSWYEAAAYAAFAGKSLPSLHHWHKAASVWMTHLVIPFGNFGSAGPLPVGRTQSLGPYGTYDMAGNVKEWCWNEAEDGKRYILGGGWNEEGSDFGTQDRHPPTDRAPENGFRCVRYLEPLPDSFSGAVTNSIRDYSRERPVSDETFEMFRSMYLYEHTPLEAKVEALDESSQAWRKEKVTFRAAYGRERMAAYLFLPKSAQPPYQAVVFMPWVTAVFVRSSANLVCMEWIDFVIKSGRAVIYPVYQSTYERRVDRPSSDIGWRDLLIMDAKDVFRSIDYLESRPDIRNDKIGFYGASMGADFGPFLAVEPRVKVAVLADGAFPGNRQLPEMDAINFVPHVKIPVLMINGRYEFVVSVEKLQKPMFRWFGTPEKDKRHVLLDTTHYALEARGAAVREILGWFDKYLGAVQ